MILAIPAAKASQAAAGRQKPAPEGFKLAHA
jgi:hypothetical protein